MTNQQATDTHIQAPTDLPDPRPGYAIATELAGSVLAQVTADQLGEPTPCDSYDVATLAAHLVAVQQRITAVGRGLDPFSVPQEAAGLAPDGYVDAWAAASADQISVWADDSILGTPLTLPFATLPGVVALHIYTSEVLVHTWDLATALGVDVAWDDQVVMGALMMMTNALPAEGRGDDVPFAEPVAVADDARPIDKLAAWLGRTPA